VYGRRRVLDDEGDHLRGGDAARRTGQAEARGAGAEHRPALGSPQVLEGFAAAGTPKLRPAKRPIVLRHLLTHTAGFSYDISTAHDYLTFLPMQLHGGSVNGARVLRSETVAMMGQNPHRQHSVRHPEDGDAGAVEQRRPLPRRRAPVGAGLHAEHAAGAERPERGDRELGRHLQHLLLARSREDGQFERGVYDALATA
jgi:hypothetical protein